MPINLLITGIIIFMLNTQQNDKYLVPTDDWQTLPLIYAFYGFDCNCYPFNALFGLNLMLVSHGWYNLFTQTYSVCALCLSLFDGIKTFYSAKSMNVTYNNSY